MSRGTVVLLLVAGALIALWLWLYRRERQRAPQASSTAVCQAALAYLGEGVIPPDVGKELCRELAPITDAALQGAASLGADIVEDIFQAGQWIWDQDVKIIKELGEITKDIVWDAPVAIVKGGAGYVALAGRGVGEGVQTVATAVANTTLDGVEAVGGAAKDAAGTVVNTIKKFKFW